MAGIQEIAKAAGIKADIVSDVFEALFQLVRDGNSVRIAGFGSFDVKTTPGRTLRSPVINGGAPTKIRESQRMVFRQSGQAKRRFNNRKKKERGVKERAVGAKLKSKKPRKRVVE